jgi:hypothetical protein
LGVVPAGRVSSEQPTEVVDQCSQAEDAGTALTSRLAGQPLSDPVDLAERAGVHAERQDDAGATGRLRPTQVSRQPLPVIPADQYWAWRCAGES